MKISIPTVGLTTHGGNRVLFQIANAAQTLGHQVTIYLPAGRNSHIFHIHDDVKIEEIGPPGPAC